MRRRKVTLEEREDKVDCTVRVERLRKMKVVSQKRAVKQYIKDEEEREVSREDNEKESKKECSEV